MDSEIHLSETLFGDADVWSAAATRNWLEEFSFPKPEGIPSVFDRDWDSCIAVTYPSPIMTIIGSYDPNERQPNFHAKARAKAMQILSTLHMVVMTNASAQTKCVLVDSKPEEWSHDVIAYVDEKHVHQLVNTADMGSPLQRTRKQLIDQLHDPRQSQLFSAVTDVTGLTCELPTDVRKSLRAACLHLTGSCHEWSESNRLLTAITALEMVLSKEDNESNYTKLQNRVNALLGADNAERLNVHSVFQSRHHFVHHGAPSASSKAALEIATSCIINFANLALKLKNVSLPPGTGLGAFCLQYLDLLFLGRKLEAAAGPLLTSAPVFVPVELKDLSIID